ncbi:hypothetical protein RHMOL_Rhmol10G0266000 [Rhododendron molle]|uniref:Uncharacterized protein n=1 Tax=Rhododendron molle TaxID=49168 RepID=A0ACC0M6M6_RHOML|nr:hypothetical protein RHMOL_Rhmol10G0266000 [Rhododendron molle]
MLLIGSQGFIQGDHTHLLRQWSNSDLNVGPSISSCISHMLFLHSFVSHYGEEDSKLSPTSCYFCKPEVKSNLL